MKDASTLINLLRQAEKILSQEGNQQSADWVADICDSLSLGDLAALDEFKNSLGGMGGFWEASNSNRFNSLISQIGHELDERLLK